MKFYKEEAAFINAEVKKQNDNLVRRIDTEEWRFTGRHGVDDIVKQAWKYVREVDVGKFSICLPYHATRFKKLWGFTVHKQKTSERMLDRADEKLAAYLAFVQSAATTRNVHPRLIAYWDQVWTLTFTPDESLVWKSADQSGKKKDSTQCSLRRTAKFKRALKLSILKYMDPAVYQREIDVEADSLGWQLKFASWGCHSNIALPEN